MKIGFSRSAVALALLASFSLGAQAADYDAGTLSPTPDVAYNQVVNSFADVISFDILTPNNVVGGSVTNLPISVGLFNITNISGLTVSLSDSLGTDYSSMFSASGSSAYTFTGFLQDGAYQLNVSGTGTGLGGAGGYTYALAAAAPVPEPEGWALLLSGLGLLGAIARRRKA